MVIYFHERGRVVNVNNDHSKLIMAKDNFNIHQHKSKFSSSEENLKLKAFQKLKMSENDILLCTSTVESGTS